MASWKLGKITELGVDGYGYVVDAADPTLSYPFSRQQLEGWENNPANSPESAMVAYCCENDKVRRILVSY